MGRKRKNKNQGYFEEEEEIAVKEFLDGCTSEARKNEIFSKILEPAFRKLVQGVLTMPKFQKIIGLYKDFDCEEGAYYHLVFNMHKFAPDRIGKQGKPTKAYSYYGTAVKNYVLGLKIQADKHVAKHGGTIDIDEIGEEIVKDESSSKDFEEQKAVIVELLKAFNNEKKLTKNDLTVLNCLKYMLTNWHKLDFQDKNQFNRLLVTYTQLPSNIVMTSLKRIKTLVLQSSSPALKDYYE